MPYLTPENKKELYDRGPQTVGELNYLLSQEAMSIVNEEGLKYQVINNIIGALSLLSDGKILTNYGARFNKILRAYYSAHIPTPDTNVGREAIHKVTEEMIGAVVCQMYEFYRRIAVPYEDKKIKENGDVYYLEGV